ncbi:MAG: ThuA domain-containing protein [Chloroflexota bacterium]
MKKVLLVSDGIFHPPLLGRMRLHRLLRMKGFSFEQVRSLEQLPADLPAYSALVLNYHHQQISPAALGRLYMFVKNGGGVLAIHAATASFKETLPYFDILGGRFVGHGPVSAFEVQRVRSGIFDGIPNFVVRDELYVHELNPGIEAHFTASLEGQEIPVVWSYHYGKGRVCYACPGHTSETMANPAYQELLQRGLRWACGALEEASGA